MNLNNFHIGGYITTMIVIIVLTVCDTTSASGASQRQIVPPGGVDKELVLTREEKLAFDKFKVRVQPYLFRDDLKHDIFLLRWLRAKHVDVDTAINDMIGLRDFYFENHIDTISDEYWDDCTTDYPFHMDAFDREGRPVGYAYLREGWDLRAAVLQGKRQRISRYLIKIVFELMVRLRDVNVENPTVTQFVVLINLDGFNLVQQACPLCLHTLISLLDIYERFLPGFLKEIIVVEAPPTWPTLYQLIRPVLSSHSKNAVKIFDTTKKQWMSYIHNKIDPKQLPSYFGGTKQDENDLKE